VFYKCPEALAPILKIIFKRSYDTGDLPDIWKNANVSPIFKKGKRFEAVNLSRFFEMSSINSNN
jgi:hypothetical protein